MNITIGIIYLTIAVLIGIFLRLFDFTYPHVRKSFILTSLNIFIIIMLMLIYYLMIDFTIKMGLL